MVHDAAPNELMVAWRREDATFRTSQAINMPFAIETISYGYSALPARSSPRQSRHANGMFRASLPRLVHIRGTSPYLSRVGHYMCIFLLRWKRTPPRGVVVVPILTRALPVPVCDRSNLNIFFGRKSWVEPVRARDRKRFEKRGSQK